MGAWWWFYQKEDIGGKEESENGGLSGGREETGWSNLEEIERKYFYFNVIEKQVWRVKKTIGK